MEGSSKDNYKVTGSGKHSSWFQEFDNNAMEITDSFHDIFGGLTDIECHPSLQTTASAQPKKESPWETSKEGSSGTERKSQEEIHLQRSRSDEVDIDREKRKKQHHQRPKRTRSAEMHYASEKRRRNRINGMLTALQGLIPNCHKDKASMLEDAVEYLKSLKLQVEMMSMARGGAMCQASYMPQAGIPSVQIPHFSPYIPMWPNPTRMGMFSMCQNSVGLPMISLPSTYLQSPLSAAGQLHPMSAHGNLPLAQVQMPFNSSAASSTALPMSATGFSAAAFNSPDQGESTSQTRRNNAI